MDQPYYIDLFAAISKNIDQVKLEQFQLKTEVGVFSNAVFFKLYKPIWGMPATLLPNTQGRIFFSVWVTDKSINEDRIFYNIHSLKPGRLPGYSIASRKFATEFRTAFKTMENEWPNVSTSYAPHTLMEGWVTVSDINNPEVEILSLTNKFIDMHEIIDSTLLKYKSNTSPV